MSSYFVQNVSTGEIESTAYISYQYAWDNCTESQVVYCLPSISKFVAEYMPKPGTVAYREHERAKVAGSGMARAYRDLADTLHYLIGVVIGSGGDYILDSEVIEPLFDALDTLKNYDRGFEGSVCCEWLDVMRTALSEKG